MAKMFVAEAVNRRRRPRGADLRRARRLGRPAAARICRRCARSASTTAPPRCTAGRSRGARCAGGGSSGKARRHRPAPPHRAHPAELPPPQRLRLPRQDRRRPRHAALHLRRSGARGPLAGLRPARAAARVEARPRGLPLPEHRRRCSRRTSACPRRAASWCRSTPGSPPTRSATSSSTPARGSCSWTRGSSSLLKPLDLAGLRGGARRRHRRAAAIPTRTSSPPAPRTAAESPARGRGRDRSRSTTPRARPGGRRASCTRTAAPT